MPIKKKKKKKRPDSTYRARRRSASHGARVDGIKRRMTRAGMDRKRPPTRLKPRINGTVKALGAFEVDSLKSTVWSDGSGKSMLIEATAQTNLPTDLADAVAAMLETDLDGIPAGLVDKLIVELGPNDVADVIRQRLEEIDPALADRIELIGNVDPGSAFARMQSDLERDSGDRSSNKAFRDILASLEQAAALDVHPDPLARIDAQLAHLNAIDSKLKAAKSSSSSQKEARNRALANLRQEVGRQRERLVQDYVGLLGTAKRTPTEVVVHLLHDLRTPEAVNSRAVSDVLQGTRDLLLRHRLTLADTRAFLEDAGQRLDRDNQAILGRLTRTLLGQLPDPATGQTSALTRLQDNVYGRVFDSAVVNALVDAPPAAVTATMKGAARAMRQFIDSAHQSDIEQWKSIAKDLQHYLNDADPRFWFTHTPNLMQLAHAGSPDEALEALRSFLADPGDNGQALVAIPYVLVKLSILAQNRVHDKRLSPWMTAANRDYRAMAPQVGRTDRLDLGFRVKAKELGQPAVTHLRQLAARDGLPDPLQNPERVIRVDFGGALPVPTEGSGITLRHQVNPFVDPTMQRSVRPTTRNMPQFGRSRPEPDGSPSETVSTALQHGLPFGSGASGSTNIMLHMLSHLQASAPNIDTRQYLLGTMMFLTYDGGHSLQEALWTANRLDRSLGLGLGIGDPDRPNEFVADYQKLVSLFPPRDSGIELVTAMNQAIEQTITHFADHSIYSKDRLPVPRPPNTPPPQPPVT